jgi:uncharacterized membrane protein
LLDAALSVGIGVPESDGSAVITYGISTPVAPFQSFALTPESAASCTESVTRENLLGLIVPRSIVIGLDPTLVYVLVVLVLVLVLVLLLLLVLALVLHVSVLSPERANGATVPVSGDDGVLPLIVSTV